METITKSKKFSLNKADFDKIIKGGFIALGGTLLTYLSTVVLETDFGTYTPIVVSIWSIVVNIATKFLSGQEA